MPTRDAPGSENVAAADASGDRVQLTLCLLPEYRDYLELRAANDFGVDHSAALRRVVAEARTLRHDMRGKLAALDLIEVCLTSDASSTDEAAQLIAGLRREMREMLRAISGGE